MSGPAAFEDLRYEIDGPLVTITLDRAEARNAYSDAMVRALVEALDTADADPEIRCIVLTGAGTAFCAGGDLKAMRDKSGMFAGGPAELRARYAAGIQSIPRAFARCHTPVVAAVNGAAIGAGLDLACMADLRIASARAKFGSTFPRVGLVPGDGGAFFLPRTIGLPRAMELMLTARVIDAARALEIDLVHEVVEPEAVLDRARSVAGEIAANAPLAVAFTKRATYQSWGADLEHALELAATYQGVVQNSEDHLEAVAAMLEKREAHFRGR